MRIDASVIELKHIVYFQAMYWRPQTIVSKDLLLNYLCMPAQHASAYPKCIGNYLFEYLGPKPGDSMHWTIKLSTA